MFGRMWNGMRIKPRLGILGRPIRFDGTHHFVLTDLLMYVRAVDNGYWNDQVAATVAKSMQQVEVHQLACYEH
jgi:hypothetical protein